MALRPDRALPALLLTLLFWPAAVWSEDTCDGAAKEIDNLAAQIAEIIKPCEDMTNNPCSNEKYQEINAQVKPLLDRGVALSKQCFGAPDAGGSQTTPTDSGGAQ